MSSMNWGIGKKKEEKQSFSQFECFCVSATESRSSITADPCSRQSGPATRLMSIWMKIPGHIAAEEIIFPSDQAAEKKKRHRQTLHSKALKSKLAKNRVTLMQDVTLRQRRDQSVMRQWRHSGEAAVKDDDVAVKPQLEPAMKQQWRTNSDERVKKQWSSEEPAKQRSSLELEQSGTWRLLLNREPSSRLVKCDE